MFIKLILATLAILLVGAFLFYRKRYRGLGLGLGFCVVTLLVGLWAIFQSRSSTAAIGILFLPAYGLFSGALGWAGKNLLHTEKSLLQGLGGICLAGALAIPGLLAYDGFENIARNRARDAKHQADLAEINRNKATLKETLARNPGRESLVIDELLATHATDRNFLLPLLESRHISADALDQLARSEDMGVALSAIRNPACRAETLVRLYRTHSYPDYFLQALASHHNSPPELLTEIFRRPPTIMGLDRSFADNPATPRALIQEIVSSTRESFVVQRLLQNPKLDCTLLADIEQALRRSEKPDDSFSQTRIAELRAGQCAGS